MVKIILTLYHPNEEAVTSYLADKLKAYLARRGHEVRIETMPEEFNLYSQARKNTKYGATMRDFEAAGEKWQDKLAEKNRDAFVISVHCGPSKEPPTRRAAKIQIGVPTGDLEIDYYKKYEIKLAKCRVMDNIYWLEARARYSESPGEIRNLANGLARWETRKYFERHADLKKTLAINYLSPIMVRRIGHLIHKELMTRTGAFRKPRGIPGMPARKKASARRKGTKWAYNRHRY